MVAESPQFGGGGLFQIETKPTEGYLQTTVEDFTTKVTPRIGIIDLEVLSDHDLDSDADESERFLPLQRSSNQMQ